MVSDDIRDSWQGMTPEELAEFPCTRPPSVDPWSLGQRIARQFRPAKPSGLKPSQKLLEAFGQRRGLLLQGRCGNGKTTFARGLVDLGRSLGFACVWVDCWQPVSIMDGCNSIFKGSPLVVVDDLGVDKPSKDYGSEVDRGATLLQRLYVCRCPFVLTSNLDAQGLMDRYGPRVFDRLKEMCCVYDNDYPSFRKSVVL